MCGTRKRKEVEAFDDSYAGLVLGKFDELAIEVATVTTNKPICGDEIWCDHRHCWDEARERVRKQLIESRRKRFEVLQGGSA